MLISFHILCRLNWQCHGFVVLIACVTLYNVVLDETSAACAFLGAELRQSSLLNVRFHNVVFRAH